MDLNNLKIAKGSRHLPKRVGLGIGSGLGKTSARGQKGQGARQGPKVPVGFEGGQLPLFRRVPKHGFVNHGRVQYQAINVKDLEKTGLENGAVVDNIVLMELGLIKNLNTPVKLLGKGELTKKLAISLQAFSKNAKDIVEKAGGSCTVLSLKDARVRFKAHVSEEEKGE